MTAEFADTIFVFLYLKKHQNVHHAKHHRLYYHLLPGLRCVEPKLDKSLSRPIAHMVWDQGSQVQIHP